MTPKEELIEFIKRLTPEQTEKVISHPLIVEAMKREKEVNRNEG